MTFNQVRSLFYLIARVMGDINAVRRGTIGQRLVRKAAGRVTGGLLSRLLRGKKA